MLIGAKLSEYHTGYRAFSREVLERLPLDANSDGFVFDDEVLAQIVWFGYVIGEVSCPTRYAEEASSLGFGGSVRYGLGCLRTALAFRLARWGLVRSPLFPATASGHERRLTPARPRSYRAPAWHVFRSSSTIWERPRLRPSPER